MWEEWRLSAGFGRTATAGKLKLLNSPSSSSSMSPHEPEGRSEFEKKESRPPWPSNANAMAGGGLLTER